MEIIYIFTPTLEIYGTTLYKKEGKKKENSTGFNNLIDKINTPSNF